jgi:hypothetical protein
VAIRPKVKSFLLLFFKKEGLSYFFQKKSKKSLTFDGPFPKTRAIALKPFTSHHLFKRRAGF